MRIFTVLSLCLFGCAAFAQATSSLTLYVAPNGNDAWTGALSAPNADGTDGPFATITGARDAIRRLKATVSAPIDVQIRAGIYRIAEPLTFTSEDSGTELGRITYTNFSYEKPVISGGAAITNWKQEGNLWVAELPEVASGAWNFTALWVNGEYRWRARTPNEGYLRTAGKAPAEKNEKGEDVPSKTAFKFTPGDIQHWENLEDAMVVVMHSWDTSHHHIKAIDDANQIVTFTGGSGAWPFENWGPRQRYYVESIREGLDAPGEWYLDRKKGLLYYWPKEGEDPAKTEVIAPKANNIIVFDGKPAEGKFIDYLTFRGLGLHHTNHVLPIEGLPNQQAAHSVAGAIDGNGARNCIIDDCEIAHIATYGLWLREGCSDNLVRKTHIHDMGAGGVRIGIGADPKSDGEATLRNTVENNWIHDGGKKYPAAVGVIIQRSSYNRVAHNEISDIYYTGVSVGWSWGYQPSSANHNIVEYNHIHDIGKYVLSDMGGIYTLGIAPGTTLRYNHIHDVYSYYYGGWGIYPDEGSSDLLIENNVVYNTKTGGFHQHYGKENRVRNNIFAFAIEGNVIRSREEEHVSFIFERNIVVFDNAKPLGSTWKNGNFRLDYNCWWDTKNTGFTFLDKSFADWQAAGNDVHTIVEDPLFENAEARDFRLKPESPAITKLGFKPIDITKAGLYGDAAWVDAPKQIKRELVSQPTD
ncbi:MAG: right-handed parallel beta-helix repeat-containing protein [Candidatus Hydrogenedentes bacterium]|nr:right-handed parallel beta-helix repeat-containing protein [Candidatus Hydrogenedentota bacterium]